MKKKGTLHHKDDYMMSAPTKPSECNMLKFLYKNILLHLVILVVVVDADAVFRLATGTGNKLLVTLVYFSSSCWSAC